MLFGVGVLFTLMMQPKGVVEDLTNLGRFVGTKLGLDQDQPSDETVEATS